jgi:hypothetical protein
MDLTPHSLTEMSDVKVAFFTCPLPSKSYCEALIVRCTGECGFGSNSNADAQFMTAMVKAGLAAWEPVALVLDLRELKYQWGDQMLGVLCAGEGYYYDWSSPPTAVVVSGLCRDGLTSLIEKEMGGNQRAADWLYESIEDAVSAVDIKFENTQTKANISQPHSPPSADQPSG